MSLTTRIDHWWLRDSMWESRNLSWDFSPKFNQSPLCRMGRKPEFLTLSLRVGFLDIHPTLYVVSPWWRRLDSVLFGPWRNGLALVHEPHTGLDHCPKILLSRFTARNSGGDVELLESEELSEPALNLGQDFYWPEIGPINGEFPESWGEGRSGRTFAICQTPLGRSWLFFLLLARIRSLSSGGTISEMGQ